MALHHGHVHGVTGRQAMALKDNFLRTLCHKLVDRKYLIDHTEKSIKGGLDRLAATDRNIAVQNLLQHLGIRHEPLPIANELFEQPLRVGLMGM